MVHAQLKRISTCYLSVYTFLEDETLDVHLKMQKRNYICHLMLYNSKIGRFVSKEVVLNLLNVYRQCYMELPCSVATQALA